MNISESQKNFLKKLSKILPDRVYLKIKYRAQFGRNLNLKNPQTFNEKLQWLKLYNCKPEYSNMVDKYEAKKVVSSIIGQEHVIPTIGVWDKFDDIDFDKLPDQFVLKCTHDCGGLVICRDKKQLDKTAAKHKIEKCLKRNYYWQDRERPYKFLKPRIIAETYIEDNKSGQLPDYKFFCFDGVVRAFFIATDRQNHEEETKFDFFDADGNHLDVRNGHPNANPCPELPKELELMKKFASVLSKGIPQVRIDFYECNGMVYFGEMTFFHWSGFVPFDPEEWDYKFGEWITLPQKNSKSVK